MNIKQLEIPDTSSLYMRVHKNHVFNNDKVMPVAFRNHEGGMSTDWSEYSTAQETRDRVKAYGKDPKNYGVIRLGVQDVRNIDGQEVVHKPLDENFSHTDVTGDKTEKVRLQFLRIFSWELL